MFPYNTHIQYMYVFYSTTYFIKCLTLLHILFTLDCELLHPRFHIHCYYNVCVFRVKVSYFIFFLYVHIHYSRFSKLR